MDDGDGFGRMGMGVGLVRPAMGRPPGVRDADASLQVLAGQARLQVLQLALGTATLEMTAFERRHAGGIIAAILEPLERVEKVPGDRLAPQDPDDPAHSAFVPAEPCPDLMPSRRLDAANAGREITMRVGVCQP